MKEKILPRSILDKWKNGVRGFKVNWDFVGGAYLPEPGKWHWVKFGRVGKYGKAKIYVKSIFSSNGYTIVLIEDIEWKKGGIEVKMLGGIEDRLKGKMDRLEEEYGDIE